MSDEHIHDFSQGSRCVGCGTGAMGELYAQMSRDYRSKHDAEHTQWPDRNCRICNPPASKDAENEQLRAEITRLESLTSAPRECPTNHTANLMFTTYEEAGGFRVELHGCLFCPRCGAPLSAPKEPAKGEEA